MHAWLHKFHSRKWCFLYYIKVILKHLVHFIMWYLMKSVWIYICRFFSSPFWNMRQEFRNLINEWIKVIHSNEKAPILSFYQWTYMEHKIREHSIKSSICSFSRVNFSLAALKWIQNPVDENGMETNRADNGC